MCRRSWNRFRGSPPSRNALTKRHVRLLLGTVTDAATVMGAAATGDIGASDTRAFRRLWPYQNLTYLRGLFDAAERGVNQSLGVPAR